MTQSWNEIGEQEAWTLEADEFTLLLGMTDKGRLGFAIQLKLGAFDEREHKYANSLAEPGLFHSPCLASRFPLPVLRSPGCLEFSRQNLPDECPYRIRHRTKLPGV